MLKVNQGRVEFELCSESCLLQNQSCIDDNTVELPNKNICMPILFNDPNIPVEIKIFDHGLVYHVRNKLIELEFNN